MSAKKIGVRGRIALLAGKLARVVSIALGRGSGGMIGGRVAFKIDPQILRKVSRNCQVVLVTGTNGKSTTTKMTRYAVGKIGTVTSNVLGDNMESGALTSLLKNPNAPFAVIEVDEMRLPIIAADTKPAGFILLNLSRDQLDRVGEITKVEQRLRQAVTENPQAIVVANCDDPLIASAAWNAPNVVWVSAGCSWSGDSTTFPLTGTTVIRTKDSWQVASHPEYTRPQPDWFLSGNKLTGPVGTGELKLQVPGRANLGNAAQAVAMAVALGVKLPDAIAAVGEVQQVAGRYAQIDIKGRLTRMILAKNPAGWQESLTMIDPSATSVVIAVNGQIADGKDLSWLWDVDFETLSHIPHVVACGERGADLAVRLRYAGVECDLVPTVWEAVMSLPEGPLDLLANYTAFRDFKLVLAQAGLWREER